MPRRNYTSDVIDNMLDAVAITGALGMTMVAPNAISAIEKPLMKFLSRERRNSDAKRIAKYLRQQKLIDVTEAEDGNYVITVTDKGNKRLSLARFDRLTIPSEQKWDGKWRIIMFDIPEQHKVTRDFISRHLRQIGLKPLQKSVLVYPYPLDEFVYLVKDMFPEVSNNIVYIVSDQVDSHNDLIKQFKTIL